MVTDKYSPPKYFQIRRKIVSSIQRGELLPGASVASENEIIERYRVSNTTARKVLHELEKEGWVTRIKGKGTFVRDFTVVRAINRIFGFTKNMIEAGRKPATRLIGFHLRDEDHSQTINGRLFTLKGPFCEIERLRLMPWSNPSAAVDSISELPASETVALSTMFTTNPQLVAKFSVTRTAIDDGTRANVRYITLTVSWNSYDGRGHTRSFTTMYCKNGLYDYYYSIAGA